MVASTGYALRQADAMPAVSPRATDSRTISSGPSRLTREPTIVVKAGRGRCHRFPAGAWVTVSEGVQQVERVGVVRGDERSQQGDRGEDRDDHRAGHAQRAEPAGPGGTHAAQRPGQGK
jgi:hypothetical protein